MKYEILENYERTFFTLYGTRLNVLETKDTFFFYAGELKKALGSTSVNRIMPKLPIGVFRAVKEPDSCGKVRRYNLISAAGVIAVAARMRDYAFLHDVLHHFKVGPECLGIASNPLEIDI